MAIKFRSIGQLGLLGMAIHRRSSAPALWRAP